jgi:Flp pilus assembly protein TadD
MPNPREAQFRQLTVDFPDSPMGHFSLGKLLLEESRFVEAAESFDRAVKLSPDYAAAYLALGTAHAGARQIESAREALERAREVALSQNHATLADEAEDQLRELEML